MRSRILLFFICISLFCSCEAQVSNHDDSIPDKIKIFYEKNQGNDLPSIARGKVSEGSLVNGKLIPYKGLNYQYFDTSSYLAGRAFVHDKVLKSMIGTYALMETQYPGRGFFIMECSNAEGGKLWPHRTHQNGLSVDFMMPLVRDGKVCIDLDTIGHRHYWLEFDNKGRYRADSTISIDFDLVAAHILILDQQARKNGLKISKVIINTDLKDELYATPSGMKLKSGGIYVVRSLTPLINALHDDHYHIDFEVLQ